MVENPYEKINENCPRKFSENLYSPFGDVLIEPYMSVYSENYDPKTYMTTVDLIYNGRHFTGTSTIHPEDRDIVPNKWSIFGSNLALMRARLKIFEYILATEINPVYRELKLLSNEIQKTGSKKAIKTIEREYQRFNTYRENVKHNIAIEQISIAKAIEKKNGALNQYRGQK